MMNRLFKIMLLPIVVLTAMSLLTACGGGGGGTSNDGNGNGSDGAMTDDGGGTTPSGGGTTPSGGGTTPSGGGTTPSGGGTTPSGGGTTPSGGGTTPPSDSVGQAQDGTRLRGLLWDDPSTQSFDLVQYKFQPTYTFTNVPIPNTEDNTDQKTGKTTARSNYINLIKRDGRYAGQTVADIELMIGEIRAGMDHGVDYYNTEGSIREKGMYGHQPGAEGSSLKEVIDAGDTGVAVIVQARGISQGIADAAWDDIAGIQSLIAEMQKYLEKAEAAKMAFEREAIRLRTEEIVRLIGPEELDDSNQRIIGGEAKAKRDAADKAQEEYQELSNENDILKTMKIPERNALEELRGRFNDENSANDPTGDDLEKCTSGADCQSKINTITTELDEKQKEVDDKNAESQRLFQEADDIQVQAEDLEIEANRLETTEVETIEAEIKLIKDTRTRARQVLEGNNDDMEGDLADLQRILGTDRNKAKAEGYYGEKVREYLAGAFENIVSNKRILLGAGTNFTMLTDLSAQGDSVFARAPRPANTVDAWTALGNTEERTIRVPSNMNDPDRREIMSLKDLIEGGDGNHRARPLEAKPATTDFTLKDSNDQANYNGTPSLGNNYEGIYKGIHGTLYYDGRLNTQNGLIEPSWFFTPTRNVVDQALLRGKNSELFRYEDTNSDGTYEVVGFIDYGMWLSDVDSTLGLSLINGVVGPQEAVDDLGTLVNVSGTRDRDNPNLASDASYSGTAEGIAARRTGEVNRLSQPLAASGHFKADVSLKATFGTSATLEGTIDNFRSANPSEQGTAHVSPDWSLSLSPPPPAEGESDIRVSISEESTPDIDGDMETSFMGVVNSGFHQGATDGEWSGVAYGYPGERPEGFYGAFRAEFSDGAAVGVYNAEKE